MFRLTSLNQLVMEIVDPWSRPGSVGSLPRFSRIDPYVVGRASTIAEAYLEFTGTRLLTPVAK